MTDLLNLIDKLEKAEAGSGEALDLIERVEGLRGSIDPSSTEGHRFIRATWRHVNVYEDIGDINVALFSFFSSRAKRDLKNSDRPSDFLALLQCESDIGSLFRICITLAAKVEEQAALLKALHAKEQAR